MSGTAIPQSDGALLAAQAKAGQAGLDAYEAAKAEMSSNRNNAISGALSAAQSRGAPNAAMQSTLAGAEQVYDQRQASLTGAEAAYKDAMASRSQRAQDYQGAIQGARGLISDQAAQAVAPIRAQSEFQINQLRQSGQNRVSEINANQSLNMSRMTAEGAARQQQYDLSLARYQEEKRLELERYQEQMRLEAERFERLNPTSPGDESDASASEREVIANGGDLQATLERYALPALINSAETAEIEQAATLDAFLEAGINAGYKPPVAMPNEPMLSRDGLGSTFINPVEVINQPRVPTGYTTNIPHERVMQPGTLYNPFENKPSVISTTPEPSGVPISRVPSGVPTSGVPTSGIPSSTVPSATPISETGMSDEERLAAIEAEREANRYGGNSLYENGTGYEPAGSTMSDIALAIGAIPFNVSSAISDPYTSPYENAISNNTPNVGNPLNNRVPDGGISDSIVGPYINPYAKAINNFFNNKKLPVPGLAQAAIDRTQSSLTNPANSVAESIATMGPFGGPRGGMPMNEANPPVSLDTEGMSDEERLAIIEAERETNRYGGESLYAPEPLPPVSPTRFEPTTTNLSEEMANYASRNTYDRSNPRNSPAKPGISELQETYDTSQAMRDAFKESSALTKEQLDEAMSEYKTQSSMYKNQRNNYLREDFDNRISLSEQAETLGTVPEFDFNDPQGAANEYLGDSSALQRAFLQTANGEMADQYDFKTSSLINAMSDGNYENPLDIIGRSQGRGDSASQLAAYEKDTKEYNDYVTEQEAGRVRDKAAADKILAETADETERTTIRDSITFFNEVTNTTATQIFGAGIDPRDAFEFYAGYEPIINNVVSAVNNGETSFDPTSWLAADKETRYEIQNDIALNVQDAEGTPLLDLTNTDHQKVMQIILSKIIGYAD